MACSNCSTTPKESKDNGCGGYQKPKGHLDSQMFPECAGSKYDRDVVKKTRERRKKGKKKNKTSESLDWYKTSKKKKETKDKAEDFEYNPWAVCHTTVDKDKDPEKYERCVKKVKKQHRKK